MWFFNFQFNVPKSYNSVPDTLFLGTLECATFNTYTPLLLHDSPCTVIRTSFSELEALSISRNETSQAPSLYQQPIPLWALSHRPDVKEAEYALRGSYYYDRILY